MKFKKISNSIFVATTILIAVVTLVFGIYEYSRERSFRIDILHSRLQLNNYQYRMGYGDESIRVTVVDTLGNVLTETEDRDVDRMENHLHRKEIQEAIHNGWGYDIKRVSITDGERYFYSATRFNDSIVRSSVPYSAELTSSLQHDYTFFYYTAGILVLLFVAMYFRMMFMRGEREKQRIKRQLTENAAHELKTPAAAIEGYLETLVSNPELPDSQRNSFLERCYVQSRRMSSLLADMATLSRLDEASIVRPNTPIDAAEILMQIAEETQSQFEGSHILLRLHIPQTMPMQGDASIVYSLFRNLFNNVLAHATGATYFDVQAKCANDHYIFKLTDNGIGVPEEHLPYIFERFYRVDKSRSRRLGGTGLGLAIAKNIALQYGDGIKAENTPGGGLTIIVDLLATSKNT
ncbi:MAG: ATP-binding protein [Bacteroidales bacterium]|nr:ATP-binding protein [Bacteroidales bacterium]